MKNMKKEKKKKLLKKEKLRRYARTGTCLSVLFLTCLACRIRRDATGSLRSDRTDSLTFLRADSAWSSHLQHLSGHTRLQWRHVRLSPPDSTGFQYPLSLAAGTLDSRKEEIRQDSVRRFSRREAAATRQEKREEETRLSREHSASPVRRTILGIGAAMLAGAILLGWIGRRKKQNA